MRTSALPPRRTSLWLAGVVLLLLLASPPAPSDRGADAVMPFERAQAQATVPYPASAGVNVNLSLALSPFSLSSGFWGTTISAEAHLLPGEAAWLNSTRSHVLVWPGANAGDRLDMLNDSMLTVSGSNLSWAPPSTNESQFIHLCLELSCEAVMQVPGEIDNASFAASVVNYTERTLGFTPAYWEIGNEPELWQEWQRPWTSWNLPPQGGGQRITPSQYAWQVYNYTKVLRTADPNIRILGIAGTGRAQNRYPLTDWVNDTVAVNAATLGGIAFHVYTAGVWGNGTLAQFYAFDTGPYSVPGRVSVARSSISNQVNATCPGCPAPPVFMTELGSALSHYQFGNLSLGFAGGLSMAASEMEGADLNVSSVDVFASVLNTSNSWFARDGTARPDATVYSDFLSRLGAEVYPAALQPPAVPPYTGSNTSLAWNLYAMATVESNDAGRSDLLLVNQNISTNVTLSPQLPGIAPGSPAELWTWSGVPHFSASNGSWWVEPSTPTPVSTFFPGGLPGSWTLPPQTIALFEAYPVASTQVTFNASGVPAGTTWYIGVDGRTLSSSSSTMEALLPTGSYPVGSVPIDLPVGSLYPNPRERLEPFPPEPLVVATAPLVVTVPFIDQWAVSWTVAPAGTGRVAPNDGWANASVPSVLTAIPSTGWVPSAWEGKGAGSFTGTGAQATITPRGSIHENVTFVPGYAAAFSESGLPVGTNWSVRVDLLTLSTTSSVLSFLEANGTYLFQVNPVSGYSASPSSANFSISGAPLQMAVHFAPIPYSYPVTWQESGLPTGTSWSVIVDGISSSSAGNALTLPLLNGTHAFSIPSLPGYQPSPRAGSAVVAGASLQVTVSFSPFEYGVEFNETGLPTGQTWTLAVGGSTLSASGPSFALNEPNGTYLWSVTPPGGYLVNPSSGSVWVHGGSAVVSLTFVASGGTPAPASSAGPALWPYLVIGGVAALAVLLLVLWSRRDRRPLPSSDPGAGRPSGAAGEGAPGVPSRGHPVRRGPPQGPR